MAHENRVRCSVMQITRKRISIYLKQPLFDSAGNIKYIGLTIANNLKWNDHDSGIYKKADRPLVFLDVTW